MVQKPKDFLFDWTWQHFPQQRDPPPAERMWRFLEFLLKESRRFNLTAIHDPREMVTRHFVDALTPLAPVDCPVDKSAELRVIDVGSGNGVPGLVIAIAFPHWRVTLLESNHKRADFLVRAVAEVEAANVEVVVGRAETVGREADHRDRYDGVLARALAILPTTLELCLPFAKPGGWFLAYKGHDCEKEVEISREAFGLLNADLVRSDLYPLEPTSLIHTALWIRKSGPTPETYPRRDGLPKKRPLWKQRGAPQGDEVRSPDE